MLFAKLFGSRKQVVTTKTSAQPSQTPALKVVPADKKQKGFDPYNSGAFNKRDAWERVPRR